MALRSFAGGASRVEVEAAGSLTLAELVALLEGRCPGIAARLLDETGCLRPHVGVFVDGTAVTRGDAAAAVGRNAEVWILPAVSGGSAAP
jgi:sulfur carrier protein ThiS